MSFEDPLHLFALLAIPLVYLFWSAEHQRRRKFAVRHPAATMIAATGVTRAPSWRRRVPALLIGLAMIGLTAAFAKPTRTVDVPVDKALAFFQGLGAEGGTDLDAVCLTTFGYDARTMEARVKRWLQETTGARKAR